MRLNPCVSVIVVVHSFAAADIVYVDDSAKGGANNGTSWADAYLDLQDGLLASQSGDEIRVGQGVYKPGPNREDSFFMRSGVVIQGGYAGLGAANPDEWNPRAFQTVLSGDVNGDDGPDFENYGDNSYHVLTADAVDLTAILRGVTVVGGNADAEPGTDHARGGGLTCENGAEPLIEDCVIERNQARNNGGGVSGYSGNIADSGPDLNRCILQDNRCTDFPASSGGGMRTGPSVLNDCVFESNQAAAGGGVASTGGLLQRCRFVSNIGIEDGGGLRGSDVVIRDCEFESNSATVHGGGAILIFAVIERCQWINNRAASGAAFWVQGAMTIEDSLLTGNVGYSNAAIAIPSFSALHMTNCILRDNGPPPQGLIAGGIFNAGQLHAVNCVFSGNRLSAIYNGGTAALFDCTIVGNSRAPAIYNYANSVSLDNCIIWQIETGII